MNGEIAPIVGLRDVAPILGRAAALSSGACDSALVWGAAVALWGGCGAVLSWGCAMVLSSGLCNGALVGAVQCRGRGVV